MLRPLTRRNVLDRAVVKRFEYDLRRVASARSLLGLRPCLDLDAHLVELSSVRGTLLVVETNGRVVRPYGRVVANRMLDTLSRLQSVLQ